MSVDLPEAADPGSVASTGGADDVHEPAITVSVTSARSTAPAVPAAVPATAVSAQLVPAAQALPAPASPVSVVTGLVSGLLAWVGLSPGLTTAPAAPAQAPLLWGLLAWVRREVERTMSNKTPTTAYNLAENSQSVGGVITGDLNAVDAEGDPLSFSVTQAPQNGSVVVNTDGTFVYTLSAQLAATGGTDVFTVKVLDQGSHFHGIGALFQPDVGHSTTATVAVTVTPMSIAVGDGPNGVAVSPDGATAYVTNAADDTVSVFDAATGDVVATAIPVGDGPTNIAIGPDGATAYVTNGNADSVSVIALPAAQSSLVALQAVPVAPISLTRLVSDLVSGLWGIVARVTEAFQRIFLNRTPTTAYDPAENNEAVDGVVTGDLNAVDADGDPLSFTLVQAPQKGTIKLHPDGTFTYTQSREFAATGGTDVFIVKVTDEGGHFHGLRAFFQPDAGHSTTATVAIFDPKVVDTIDVGQGPTGLAVSPDGDHVYVTSLLDGAVSVIDTETGSVTTIAVGNGPRGVAVTPDGDHVYVANLGDDTVSVIDTETGSVTTIAVGEGPGLVAVSPDGDRVYVANFRDGTISVIDTDTNTVTKTIAVGDDSAGVAVSPDGDHVYVTDLDGTVSVIDAATNTVIDTIAVGNGPEGVAVSPDGTRLYVTNKIDGTVSVISV